MAPLGSNGLETLTPGAPTAQLTGFVFVDTDSNGVLDAAEAGFGVADITVYLCQNNITVQTTQTDANGMYSFTVLYGEFTIKVAESTPEADFNEGLFESYDPTTPLAIDVVASSANLNTNFGFNPQVEEITERLQEGDLESNGLPLEYWRRQIILALTKLNPPDFGQPNPEEPDYEAAELQAFLLEIEGLAFPMPFDFEDGNELVSALKVLGDPLQTPIMDLAKELLTFELNHAAGLGLVSDPNLQLTLINYAESVYINEGGLAPSNKRAALAPTGDNGVLQKTKLMLEEANRGGGGGPVQ